MGLGDLLRMTTESMSDMPSKIKDVGSGFKDLFSEAFYRRNG
jgi:hypothetical protein